MNFWQYQRETRGEKEERYIFVFAKQIFRLNLIFIVRVNTFNAIPKVALQTISSTKELN